MRNHITGIDAFRKGTAVSLVRAYMPTNDLAKLQGAGFGVLRPIWDLDKAMYSDGSINHAYMDGMFDLCARWLGISPSNEVVLCCYKGPNTLGWSAWKEMVGGDPSRAIKFYLNLTAYVLTHYKPGRVWIEFGAEPEVSAQIWKPVQRKLYDAVRSKSIDVGVIVGFGNMSGLSDIMSYGALDYTVPDPRRRWTYHQYAPWWILRQLGNAPGEVYDLDYSWPMSVPEMCDRFVKLGKDPTLRAKEQALSDEQQLVDDIKNGVKPLPAGQTLDSLMLDCSAKINDIIEYADNMARYEAWGMGIDPQTGQTREWTMTGNHDAVPFTYEGMYRTLKVARDWELATGETLMMTEGGGGGWAYGSQTPEARATILRLQATQAQVYKDLGWKQWGWWMGNSLFLDDTVPGQRQIDAELLESIVGVAI